MSTRDRCDSCLFCKPAGDTIHYVCEAERLPDPAGDYHALPNRTATQVRRLSRLFRFGQTGDQREATRVWRFLSPGPVEGFSIILFGPQAGSRVAMTYNSAPCPAWYPR